MSLYHWQALTDAGEPRQGALAGESEVQVIESLRREGLRVTRVLREQAARELPRVRSHAPELRLLRELLALRSVGLGVPAALARLAAARTADSLAGELALVRRAVETGQPLGEALARVPHRFDELVCRVLAAGEARGDLDGALQRLVAHLERSRRPTILGLAIRRVAWTTAATALLIVITLGLLLPAAAGVYLRLGVPAARGSAALLGVAVAVQPALPWLAGAALALGLTLAWGLRTPSLRTRLDALALQVPGLGSALRLHGALRLTRLLALLSTVELPLLSALELAAPRLGNQALGLALLRARTHVAQGVEPGTALMDADLLPPVAVELLRGAGPGERTTALGALVGLCEAAADDRARRIEQRTHVAWVTLAAACVACVVLVLRPALGLV